MLRGGLRSSFSMKTYLTGGAASPMPVEAAERAAQLAQLRFDKAKHGAALDSMMRVAALLHSVDTTGVEPLETLIRGSGGGARDLGPFSGSVLRTGLLVLPRVKQE